MGRGKGAGTGSPVWFRCWADRRGVGVEHAIQLTDNERPSRRRRGHIVGLRSSGTDREYMCSCGHVGWSNHMDLERLVKPGGVGADTEGTANSKEAKA